MPRDKPPVLRLHELKPGQTADVFALLAEKSRNTTRDGKPFYSCRFKDRRRTVGCVVWADAPLFAECEAGWQVGTIYKVRGTFNEHERYGPQIELRQVRAAQDA